MITSQHQSSTIAIRCARLNICVQFPGWGITIHNERRASGPRNEGSTGQDCSASVPVHRLYFAMMLQYSKALA